MKIIYHKYIKYVIGQAVDVIFAKNFYDAYKIRFNEIKSVTEKDLDVFIPKLERKSENYSE